jgi:hypothetical protein
MRRAVTLLVALALLAVSPPPARADNMLWADGAQTSATVNVPTTTETVAISSNQAVASARPTVRVLVIGWCQLTTGPSTTLVTPRIRRGATSTGVLVGTPSSESFGAAGVTAHFLVVAFDTLSNVDNAQYSLTVQQTAATGAGTVQQAGILVLVFA